MMYPCRKRHFVFVYGTLKKGERNHHLLQGCKGTKALAPGMRVHCGPGYPYAIRGEGTAIGELYEVDEQTLKRLDELEGHPEYYRRELTEVVLEDGKELTAWIYLNERALRYPLKKDSNR